MVASFKTNLLDWLKTKVYVKNEIDTKLQNKSDINHTHDISELYDNFDMISGIQDELNEKADKSVVTTSVNGLMSKKDKVKLDGIATEANKTVVDSSLSSSSTNPVQNKVVNSALSGKANSSHSHSISNITNLQSSLDGKSPTSHTHDDRYYTESEINTKLNGKANSSHTHSIGDVTNLQSKLNTIPTLTSSTITVSGTNNIGTITFYKFGKIVIMELNLSKVNLSSTWNVVGIVPSGYMPKLSDGAGSPMVWWSVQGQQGQSAQLNIKSTGEIRFAYGNGDTPQLNTYVTYIVN